MKLILLCFTLIQWNSIFAHEGNDGRTVDGSDVSSDEVMEKWKSMMSKTHQLTSKYISENRDQIETTLNQTNVTETCMKSVMKTFDGIMSLEDWAIEMYNSWGHFPAPGFFQGTFSDFGSYDQCLAIEPNEIIGQPKYCSIDFVPFLPRRSINHNIFHNLNGFESQLMLLNSDSHQNLTSKNNIFNKVARNAGFFYYVSMRVGVCVPSSCRDYEIELIAQKYANELSIKTKKVYCETKQDVRLTVHQAIGLFLLILFIALNIIGFFVEIFKRKDSNWKWFLSFSPIRNMTKIFNFKTTSTDLGCIHGIRFLTLTWMIMGHSFLWVNYQLFSRTFQIKKILTSIELQPWLNAAYSVDTFFVISGVLTTYVTWTMTQGNRSKYSQISFITARFIRLTPQLFIFVWLTFLIPLISSGPIWHETVDTFIESCYENWWVTLLYIQNYVNIDAACNPHIWWLATDFQFHILISFVILIIFYNDSIGNLINLLIAFVMAVITGLMTYNYNFPPAIVNTQRDDHFDVFLKTLYWKPYSHGPCYFLGAILGYYIVNKRIPRFSEKTLKWCWTVILLSYIAVTYDSWYYVKGARYNPLISAFTYPGGRIIWTICTVYVIGACSSGNGGIINKFLSWKGFVPLSRMSYSVYLTHVWSLWIFIGTQRERVDTSQYSAFFIFLGHWLWVYGVGSVFMVIFELPIIETQKRIYVYFGFNDKNKMKNENNKIKDEHIKMLVS